MIFSESVVEMQYIILFSQQSGKMRTVVPILEIRRLRLWNVEALD